MITHFATSRALLQLDILASLIWAVRKVRLNVFKKAL